MKMEHLNPKNQFQVQLVSEMFSHLNELSTYQWPSHPPRWRFGIPPPIWLPIILGVIIIDNVRVLMDIEQ